jgi:hypothetical protein
VSGNVIGAIGSPGTDNGQFVEAHGLTLDRAGNAYVTDVFTGGVRKFAKR